MGEVMRGSVIRGCARGSYRLQGVDRRRWPFAPRGDESLDTGMGLALLRESAGGAKERRKPDRWWQNREIGGGFPQIGRIVKTAFLGSTCRRKALWVGKVVPFDEGAAEATLAPHERRSGDRSMSGARQGASEVVRQPGALVDNTSPRRHHKTNVVLGLRTYLVGSRERCGRSWRRAVKRVPSRGRITERWCDAAWKAP